MATTFSKVKNNAETTLTEVMLVGATDVDVADGAIITPAAFPFRASIQSEIVEIGARSGNNLSSITRGVEGTTPAEHPNGTPIFLNLTAGVVQQMQDAINTLEAGGGGLSLTASDWFVVTDFTNGWIKTAASGGDIETNTQRLLRVITTAAAGSRCTAALPIYNRFRTNGGDAVQADAVYDFDHVLEFLVTVEADVVDSKIWLMLGLVDEVDDPGYKSIGFRIDQLALKGICRHTGALNVVDLSMALSVYTEYRLRVVHIAGSPSTTYWYVNDDLKGSTTTGSPSGSQYDTNCLVIAHQNPGVVAGNAVDVFKIVYQREYA